MIRANAAGMPGLALSSLGTNYRVATLPARLQRAVQFLQQVFIRGLIKVMEEIRKQESGRTRFQYPRHLYRSPTPNFVAFSRAPSTFFRGGSSEYCDLWHCRW